MQMMFGMTGFGLGVPKTKIEIGGLNILKFYIRHNKASKIHKFQVIDLINIGGKSGSFIGSAIETKWFELDPAKSHWAFQPHELIGKRVQVITSGIAIIMFGKVDFTFKKLNKYNEPVMLVDRCCIEARGITFSEIKIQGKVERSVI